MLDAVVLMLRSLIDAGMGGLAMNQSNIILYQASRIDQTFVTYERPPLVLARDITDANNDLPYLNGTMPTTRVALPVTLIPPGTLAPSPASLSLAGVSWVVGVFIL